MRCRCAATMTTLCSEDRSRLRGWADGQEREKGSSQVRNERQQREYPSRSLRCFVSPGARGAVVRLQVVVLVWALSVMWDGFGLGGHWHGSSLYRCTLT